MTDEELEKKAERYARNSLSTLADTVIQDNVKLAYIKGAKENTPVWHYPSEGELSKKEIPVRNNCYEPNILIYTKSEQLRVGFYKDNEFHLIVGADLPQDLVIAWQYIEPPKEQ